MARKLFGLVILMVLGYVGMTQFLNTDSDEFYDDPQHLAWCEDIYHRNVGCPLYGRVEVPLEVLARQEAEHLAWCEDIYHRNVGCPLYGRVEVPLEVLQEEERHHLEWCASIGNANVSCPHEDDESEPI